MDHLPSYHRTLVNHVILAHHRLPDLDPDWLHQLFRDEKQMTKSELHDALYDAANKVLEKANPCGIHMVDGKARCNNPMYSDDGNLCCGGCIHLTPTGCSVRSLSCKLWTCGYLSGTPAGRTTVIAMDALRSVAWSGRIKVGMVRATQAEECQ